VEFGFGRGRDAALFNDPGRLRQKYGARCAEKIEARLAQITAAATLDILCRLPQARCHQLVADRSEQFSLDLDHPRRLIVGVADNPVPRLDDGGIDRSRVQRLIFIGIADTH
jgi:plasmid maintenance system killer protein